MGLSLSQCLISVSQGCQKLYEWSQKKKKKKSESLRICSVKTTQGVQLRLAAAHQFQIKCQRGLNQQSEVMTTGMAALHSLSFMTNNEN